MEEVMHEDGCLEFTVPIGTGSVVNACGKCYHCKENSLKEGTLYLKFDEEGYAIDVRDATASEIKEANKLVDYEKYTDEVLKIINDDTPLQNNCNCEDELCLIIHS